MAHSVIPKTFFQDQETIAALLERASKLAQQQMVEASPNHEDTKTLLNVAQQVAVLVGNLTAACTYLSQMNQTYKNVNSAVKEKITLLGTWCTDLKDKNIAALKSRGVVDQIFKDNSLTWMPRIDTLSLQIVNPKKGELTIKGYFPCGGLQKWEHSFIFNGKRFDRTEDLKNDILKYELDLPPNLVQGKHTALTATLRVEWQTSYLMNRWIGWKSSEFPCVVSMALT